jgi:LCP family protein required for cell wall assembly
VLAAGAVAYWYALDRRVDRVALQLHPSTDDGTTYLIIGSDSRAGIDPEQRGAVGRVKGGRADLVLLLRIPDGGGPPRLLSVPRDLLVLGREDLGLHRLSLSLLDGPQATVDVLCRSLGVSEDHYVQLDLAGFTEIVNSVGGVDVDIDAPTRDTVLNFEVAPGRQHLDGPDALLYVRARHLEQMVDGAWQPVPNQRAEQAQAVLRAVAAEAHLSLTDPLATHRLLWATSDALTVDDGTGMRDLAALARALRRLPASEDVRLPALEDDSGPIPFAQLEPNAGAALAAVGAGGSGCRRPALPEAARS